MSSFILFFNKSVKKEPILLIFGTPENSYQIIISLLSHLQNAATVLSEIQKSPLTQLEHSQLQVDKFSQREIGSTTAPLRTQKMI